MENNPSNHPIAPKTLFGFGHQFLVFLIVLNLGALYALVDLYRRTERAQKDLEHQKTELLRDSLRTSVILDSIRLAQPAKKDSLESLPAPGI